MFTDGRFGPRRSIWAAMAAALTITTVTIAGMRSYACCEAVSSALNRVQGVRDVSVSLLQGRATVLHEGSDPGALKAAVASAGYAGTLA